MTVYDDARDGKYENKMVCYFEELVIDPEKTTIAGAERAKAQWKVDRTAHRNRFREETCRLEKQFQTDLEVEHNVVGHPTAWKVFEFAWARGHDCDYAEVALHYADFVELIQP
jgi:hypothetical protein